MPRIVVIFKDVTNQDKSESSKKKGKEYICSVCIQKHTKFAKHVQNSPLTSKPKHIQRFKQDKPESSKQKGKECIWQQSA